MTTSSQSLHKFKNNLLNMLVKVALSLKSGTLFNFIRSCSLSSMRLGTTGLTKNNQNKKISELEGAFDFYK